MSFVWCASAHALATQMSHPPVPFPPVKQCPTNPPLRATARDRHVLHLIHIGPWCGWETDILPLLALTRRGAAQVKTSTGKNFLENARE